MYTNSSPSGVLASPLGSASGGGGIGGIGVAATGTTTSMALLEATTESPWSVDAVSAIPAVVHERLNSLNARDRGRVTSAVSGDRWFCVCLPNRSATAATTTRIKSGTGTAQFQIYVWHATGSLQNQKHNAKIWILEHDDTLVSGNGDNDNNNDSNQVQHLLVALASPTPDTAFVYAIHPITKRLVVWNLKIKTPSAFQNTNSGSFDGVAVSSSKIKALESVIVGSSHNDLTMTHSTNITSIITATCLTVHWNESGRRPVILVGLSNGSLYWIWQSKLPVTLRAVPVVDSAVLSLSSTSFLGRLWSSSSPSTAVVPASVQPIVSCHYVSADSFVSVSKDGQVRFWKATPTETSPNRIVFAIQSQCQLPLLLQQQDQDLNIAQLTTLQTSVSTIRSGSDDDSSTTLHGIVLVQCQSNTTAATTPRLYWVALTLNTATVLSEPAPSPLTSACAAVWLDRFALPESVRVEGLCAVDDGIAYAVFGQDDTSAMALSRRSAAAALVGIAVQMDRTDQDDDMQGQVSSSPCMNLFEVDFSTDIVQSIVPSSMVSDVITHGVTVLDAQGYGLRLRVDVNPEPPSTPRADQTNVPGLDIRTVHQTSSKISVLSQHLQSSFARFYAENQAVMAVRLPPSLTTNATLQELEEAAILCATRLANTPSVASMSSATAATSTMLSNPMDTHQAFINMLREGGVYRNMSQYTKWKLLSIGQHVCVFMSLQQLLPSVRSSTWERKLLEQLSLGQLNNWLLQVQTQSHEAAAAGQDDQAKVWLSWLVSALEAAVTYREEQARVLYVVASHKPPPVSSPNLVPSWTSDPTIRQLLFNQLDYWLDNTTSFAALSSSQDVEDVIQKVLVSCSDSFHSCRGDETRAAYVRAQKNAFAIIRSTKGGDGDAFLFELANAHRYYQGICQISFEHQSRRDLENYAIAPLFAHLSNEEDVETGLPFGRYVLQWHLDRKYYGCLLEYGKNCPDDLKFFLDHHEILAPYRWMHSVTYGDYNEAAESLVQQATTNPNISVANANSALCMASLTNSIVEHDAVGGKLRDVAAKRRRFLERKRELVNAQCDILKISVTNEDVKLLVPGKLVYKAFSRCDEAQDPGEKADVLMLALAACTSYDNEAESKHGALLVWTRAILSDRSMWEHWLSSPNLTNPALIQDVRQESVFGLLHQLVEKTPEWNVVSFPSVIQLGLEVGMATELDPLLQHPGLMRILSVATGTTNRQERDAMPMSE